MKSYKLFILFILFISQLIGCAPSTIIAIPASIADRRTTEVQVIDNKIFLAAWSPIQAITDNEKQKSHFNIIVYNKAVVIVGQVPTKEVKNKITDVLSKLENVKTVHNKTEVSKANKLKQRAKDTITTSNVKTRLFLELKNEVHPMHVKIMTENDVIYLLGIVNEKEADEAIQIAKSSKGVKLVVPLFELDQDVKNKY
ncbi:BON domain-containing protein [Methylophilaceae bacterium]|jgi:osmotically-inducible protein OsmY|nr:BON domain-containing protein [Methylophilaceae bacterium]|tara:strand:+ start:2048 stop:2641 length:594 start_codon:yes stop_codon:yes gene_type:complete